MRRSKKVLTIIFMICCFVVVFVSCLQKSSNGDTYFMLSHGRWILANGLYPEQEMLTMHEGLHFTFQKWLTCIILYKTYLIGGELALRSLMGICTIVFIILLRKLLYMVNKNDLVVNIMTLGAGLFLTRNIVASPRIFTYIFLVLELMCLEKYKRSKNNYKYLIPIPFLACLCMNLHSTQVIIMFIFMLPYICDLSFIKFKSEKLNNLMDKYILKEDYKRRNIIYIFIISIFSLLINPYGFESLIYIVNGTTMSGYNSLIMELQHPEIKSFIAGTIGWLFIYIVGTIRNKKISMIYSYLLFGTIFMYAMYNRNLSYVSIAGPFISCVLIGDYVNKYDTVKINLLYVVFVFIFTIFFAFFLMSGLIKTINKRKLGFISDLQYYTMMIDDFMRQYLKDHHPNENIDELVSKTRVYVYPSGGSYLEFVGYKAFIDCRSEVFYKSINKKEDIQLDYYNLITGKMNYKDFFAKYQFDFIITLPNGVDTQDIFEDDMARDPDYELILSGTTFKLFVPVKE